MSILDRVLDASVVLSYDRNGFRRHARAFNPADLQVDLSGKVMLVTGANSGIGFAAASALAERGARVHLLCRNPERGQRALERLQAAGGDLVLELVDMSSLASIRACCEALPAQIDVLVHNAGVLPSTHQTTAEGHELTFATNLLGPQLMTHLLADRLVGGRVVFVSSGGMYTQALDITQMLQVPSPFDGVVQYARTKRAMVVLNELWAERRPDIQFMCMHPGWADTPSVATSIPRFHAVTKRILRSSEQGADTVIWLAACPHVEGSGRFWFDRKAVSTHYTRATREDDRDRAELWDALAMRLSF